MKRKTKEIFQIISAIIILAAGASLTFRFLDGRMLIGIILMIAGVVLLVRMALVEKVAR